MAEQSQELQKAEASTDVTAKNKPSNGSKGAKGRKKRKPKRKGSPGRRPGPKPYPIIPFEQALRFGQGIADFGAGHPMKRSTLLEKLSLPVNQTTKDLITASNKYGITVGSHGAPEFKLTEEGTKAVAPAPSLERNRARIKLAITDIEPFKRLYDKFSGGKLPAVEAMQDCLDDLNEGDRAPCVTSLSRMESSSGYFRLEKALSLSQVSTKLHRDL